MTSIYFYYINWQTIIALWLVIVGATGLFCALIFGIQQMLNWIKGK